jgi:hypothetical protein
MTSGIVQGEKMRGSILFDCATHHLIGGIDYPSRERVRLTFQLESCLAVWAHKVDDLRVGAGGLKFWGIATGTVKTTATPRLAHYPRPLAGAPITGGEIERQFEQHGAV